MAESEGFRSNPWLTLPAIVLIVAMVGAASAVALAVFNSGGENGKIIIEVLTFLTALLNVLKTQEVHNLTNSRMTELARTIGIAKFAEGRVSGAEEERIRSDKARDQDVSAK